MSKWLKDPATGALYRVDGINTAEPVNIRGDRNDQTKITAVHSQLTTTGGHAFTTTIPFDQVVKLLDPPPAPASPPAE